ncbi:hypothetical protein HPB50_013100 [Hyalomma asiaticum]|uniref:Uncharacterized protein n=1 Tax=Hyalomma asiaticum TaxID=266040 RepID=A0ACB7RIE8_HYAAI|nr:hypothetical protein HPB50_013100 [Hyalomma asiaticum]
MVPQLQELQASQAGTLEDENPEPRGGHNSTGTLPHDGGFSATDDEDVEENNRHFDWQEWMSSVQVRNRTEAFYRLRRRLRGNFDITDETNRGRLYFLRRRNVRTGKSVDELANYKKILKMYYLECGTERNLEPSAPSSNARAQANYAYQVSKSSLSRQSTSFVGSAEWYAALKERIRIAKSLCVPKQSQFDRCDVVLDAEGVPVPSLTPEMQLEVEAALVAIPREEGLASAFRLNISRADMHTLADGRWLNDEVVNFYMNLIMERSEKEGTPRVYAFNTFFYPKLLNGGHAALKRWTPYVDLFSFDILLVPLHSPGHWCLAVVDFRRRHFAYYDSLNAAVYDQIGCLELLQQYLEDESQHKRNHGLDWENWTLKIMDVPQQQNGSDCGMFTCQYAECISRDAPISFGQQDMAYFRKRVVYEILHQTILSV